jgi:hypothetical protein
VIERGGQRLVTRLISDREYTTIYVWLRGLDPVPEPGPEPWRRLLASVDARDDRGRPLGLHPKWLDAIRVAGRGGSDGRFNFLLKLTRLAPDVRRVDLAFGGPAGDWRIRIPVSPHVPDGEPATAIVAGEVRNGIGLAATAIGRADGMTGIEIEAEVVEDRPDAHIRIDSIGGYFGGRINSELLVLHDDDDPANEYVEELDYETPLENPQVLFFENVPANIRRGHIDVPFVTVEARTDENLSLPVPSETELRFLGCRARVSVSRVAEDHRFAGFEEGPKVRVAIRPVEAASITQLAYFTHAALRDLPYGGTTVGHGIGEFPYVTVPDPGEAAVSVTLSEPILRILGPWRLEIPF